MTGQREYLGSEGGCLNLFKEDFRFAAAHFMIFDSENAERLHGHNYRVALTLGFSGGPPSQGYQIDFRQIKSYWRKRIQEWDERVILPRENPHLVIDETEDGLRVSYRTRQYVFPKEEVLLLPIYNTSSENLAELLIDNNLAQFADWGFAWVAVSVEETPGQSATLRKPITHCG